MYVLCISDRCIIIHLTKFDLGVRYLHIAPVKNDILLIRDQISHARSNMTNPLYPNPLS